MKHIFFFLSITLLLTSCAPEPVADFKMEVSGEVSPVNIAFTNSSENAESYFWDFGDGQTSNEENPTHTYEYWGVFNITLTAMAGEKSVVTQRSVTITEAKRKVIEIVTDFGTMRAELSNLTPKHRDNFVKLAEEGFYNGLLFHRVMEGFMIQGGDPESRNAPANKQLGNGGPGYTIPAEFRNGLHHYKGALAAARQGGPINPQKASSGSQFYIVDGNPVGDAQLNQHQSRMNFSYTEAERNYYKQNGGAHFLDQDYTVFGYVGEGMEVIDAITSQPTSSTNPNRPVKDIKIISVTVIE